MNVKTKQLVALRSHNKRIKRWVASPAPPTPQEAVDGGAAYERGGVPGDNPYPPLTQQHEDWAWGFEETEYRVEYERQEAAY